MNDTENIKNSIDIVDLVSDSVKLTDCGGGIWKGALSAGSQSGQSLNVDKSLQLWIDWPTQKGGDAFNWIAYRENLDIKHDFPKIIKIAADYAGVELTDDGFDYSENQQIQTILTAATNWYHQQLTDELRELITKKWGITNETIDRYKIGFAPSKKKLFSELNTVFPKEELVKTGLFIQSQTGSVFDLYDGRIVFPYWKNGAVVYTIARKTEYTPDSKYEQQKFKKQFVHNKKHEYVSKLVKNEHFYGEDSIRGTDCCVITEGVADCLAALQNNIPCISPVTTKFRKADMEKIYDMVKEFRIVYLCNDNEISGAGLEGSISTAGYLEDRGVTVRIVHLPRPENIDKIDLAEYLKNHNVQEFYLLLNNAETKDQTVKRFSILQRGQDIATVAIYFGAS